MEGGIEIKVVWSESAKQYLVQFDFAAYYKSELNKQDAAQIVYESINNILSSLSSMGIQIKSNDVTYLESTVYKRGDRIDGREIEEIYFYIPHNHVIYRNKGETGIRFELFSNPKERIDTSLLSIKMMKIYSLLPNNKREPYYGRIANGINENLLSKSQQSAILDEVIETIISIRTKEEQMNYLMSYATGMIIILLIGLLLILNLPSEYQTLLYMGLFGIFGGIFSVALDVPKYAVDLNAPRSFYIKTGLLRLVIALISGMFSYFVIKSNLFLGFFAHNQESMILAAIAAGFSEKLITNIIDKIHKQTRS